MKILLALVAVGEAATGLVLLVYPPILVKLLFGAEIAGGRSRDKPHCWHQLDSAWSGLLPR
jgi:hypothetical protein